MLGRVAEISRSHSGTIDLQKAVVDAYMNDKSALEVAVTEVACVCQELSIHTCANYVVQRMLEFGE